ncbi:MAG: rhomboid family intramembrane serine protease [Fimbriimonadales bacterium]
MTASTCMWCAVAFLGVNIQHGPALQARWGLVSEERLYDGSVWGLVTNAFVHVDPLHLLFNLYWVWILGGAFERTFGLVRTLLFILVSAFVSSGLQIYTGLGIGLSGVGYALFGFGWVGRKRYPEFARTVTPITIQMFVLWGILCIFLTNAHMMNVGNVAHASGLLFGAAVAGMILIPAARIALTAALALMATGATASLYWNPYSLFWVANQAEAADGKHQYARAEALYKRTLDLHANPVYSWAHLAEIYGNEHQTDNLRSAISTLRGLGDPDGKQAATDLIQEFGDPDKPEPLGKGDVK